MTLLALSKILAKPNDDIKNVLAILTRLRQFFKLLSREERKVIVNLLANSSPPK